MENIKDVLDKRQMDVRVRLDRALYTSFADARYASVHAFLIALAALDERVSKTDTGPSGADQCIIKLLSNKVYAFFLL